MWNRRQLLSAFATAPFWAPSVVRAAARPVATPTTVTAVRPWYPIVQLGDRINARGEVFGSDADFTAVLPLPGAPDRLLLWVNHEYPPSAALPDDGTPNGRFARYLRRTPTPDDLLDCMGASVVELQKRDGQWRLVADSQRAWRLSGRGPVTKVTGPAAGILGPEVRGTLENCGGGLTPWGTVLTCEENTRYNVGEGLGVRDGKIGQRPPSTDEQGYACPGLRGEHYGWVVEVDPLDPTWAPRRHTALARYRHEMAAVVAEEGQPLRVYMGDDRGAGGLWRFTSSKPWSSKMKRDEGSRLLEEGALEIAQLRPDGRGSWIAVTGAALLRPGAAEGLRAMEKKWKLEPGYIDAVAKAARLEDLYATEGAARVDGWLAGLVVGGSGLGRPEGCVWIGPPRGGALYCALTGRTGLEEGHPFRGPAEQGDGLLLKVEEGGGSQLRWSVLAGAGEHFAAPDNLAEGRGGALLVATDSEDFAGWGNNGLWQRSATGVWERLLVAPPEAEVCGPSFAPDGSLFCAIQHPAEAWGNSQVVALNP